MLSALLCETVQDTEALFSSTFEERGRVETLSVVVLMVDQWYRSNMISTWVLELSTCGLLKNIEKENTYCSEVFNGKHGLLIYNSIKFSIDFETDL